MKRTKEEKRQIRQVLDWVGGSSVSEVESVTIEQELIGVPSDDGWNHSVGGKRTITIVLK